MRVPSTLLAALLFLPAGALPAAAHSGIFSGPLEPGQSWSMTTDEEADIEFRSLAEPGPAGHLRVRAEAPAEDLAIEVRDGPMRFVPAEATVGIGARITWLNNGTRTHTITGTLEAPQDAGEADRRDADRGAPLGFAPALLAAALAAAASRRRVP